MKISVILLLFPLLVFGQQKQNFNKLISEINHDLNQYGRLIAFGNEYYAIVDFGLSKKEIKQIMNEDNDQGMITTNKDSIQNVDLISYFQGKIEYKITEIVNHPDFLKNDVTQLIPMNSGLSIVKSDDNKLFNFSFDEKTGGTYRSQISKMYYLDEQSNTMEDVTSNPVFANDGYNGIYTLQTSEGMKYVLTAYVRGCSYCFETTVQLLNPDLTEAFIYSVNNRDWNDGVFYDHKTKTIIVDYYIDDLTSYCHCNGEVDQEKFQYDRFSETEIWINCKCKFIFDGENFELVEESWKKMETKENRE